jgi:glycerophosphoryl diester phosphodiesterase
MIAVTPAKTLEENKDSGPLIVAHRGASAEAPENTLPAFNLAWEQGADAIEGDFYLTKDGAIVCFHDADTARTAGVTNVIVDTTLEELGKLDVGLWKGEQWKGTKIPTIAEVFETIPDGKKIYIEIKTGPEIVQPLLEEIRKSGLQDEQIVVISFSPNVVHAIKTSAPQFKAFLLSGLKKDESGKIDPSVEHVLDLLQRIGADGFSSTLNVIDQSFIQHIMDAGYEHHVWTVNDLETARRFKEWGTKSITTDVPKTLGPVRD